MGIPEIANYCCNSAVMVRVRGPDPKGLKMRNHAFHQYNSGTTTLSASGMFLPDTLFHACCVKQILGKNNHNLALVVTVASVFDSFLALQQRLSVSQGGPEMIPGARIDVMLEGKLGVEGVAETSLDGVWHPAQLIRLVDVPESSLALQSLIESSSGSLDQGWEVGWSLASYDNGPRTSLAMIQRQAEDGVTSIKEHLATGESYDPSMTSKRTTRIALLGVFLHLKDPPIVSIASPVAKGDSLLTVGSPFGVLSPLHFFNSLSTGSIANCFPARSLSISLLMTDIRCLPGMEGAPVFGEAGHFVGILTRPLKQKSTGAEIQLVIPWEAIANASSDLLLKVAQNAGKGTKINEQNLNANENMHNHESDRPFGYMSEKHNHHSPHCSSPLPVEKMLTSVCLITIDEGVWASGVLLNDQGLVLANAHLLEPWRFGKTAVNGGRNGTKSREVFFPPEENVFPRHSDIGSCKALQSNASTIVDASLADQRKGYHLNLSSGSQRNIRIRLDHVNPWIWCDAKVVYVSKGPLDVALLQLEYVPDQLCPVKTDYACPILGSKAYIIGHGLFGPRCGFSPSVCSGLVSKVVKVEAPSFCKSILGGDSQIPAMLETTAAVYSGGSGGAVINSKGHMIGLVTSNARHGGGTIIPHLNFSISCAVLAPIFEFAKDMRKISLLGTLDQPNQHLSSIWALMPSLSPKPRFPLPNIPQSLFEDNQKQAKGFKFAKFIAERDKLLRSSTELGKVENISNEILPSKL